VDNNLVGNKRACLLCYMATCHTGSYIHGM